MFDERVEKIKNTLLMLAPDIFGKHPVMFAYLYGSYDIFGKHPVMFAYLYGSYVTGPKGVPFETLNLGILRGYGYEAPEYIESSC